MSRLRDIGYLIDSVIMNRPELGILICNELGFTQFDLFRFICGRVSISPKKLSKLSELINIDIKDILYYTNNDSYSNLIDYEGSKLSQEGANFILDIIDSYIDIKEGLENERL